MTKRTWFGKGVKVEKAEMAMAQASSLVNGELVWFYADCNQLRPMIDAVVVANARIMGLSTTEWAKYKYKALVTQVAAVQYDQRKGRVAVTTTDGQVMTFRGINSEDVPALRHYLEYAREHPAPEHVTDALTKRRARERSAEPIAMAREAGQVVESGSFALKTVTIYQNGFVRVAGTFSANAPYERLLSIEASADVGKKTALGRGAGAVVTGGMNLFGSKQRGDVYLTIVTDHKTHVLHEDPPTVRGMKASKRLEAAGTAVVRSAAARDDAATGVGSDQAISGDPTSATWWTDCGN